MARKRTIKPNFNDNDEIARLGPWARLLYILSWCHMDANGVIEDSARSIRSKIFPRDDFTLKEVEAMIDELVRERRFVRFKAGPKAWLWAPKFRQHQKIHFDEPGLVEVPLELRAEYDMPESDGGPEEYSTAAHGMPEGCPEGADGVPGGGQWDVRLPPEVPFTSSSPSSSAFSSASTSPSASASGPPPAGGGGVLMAGDLEADTRYCAEAWERTLERWRAKRPITKDERNLLRAMVHEHGRDTAWMAILGARHERGNDTFDPSDHLYLDRVFNPKKLSRFLTLGAKALQAREERALASTKDDPAPDCTMTHDQIRELIKARFPDVKLKPTDPNPTP